MGKSCLCVDSGGALRGCLSHCLALTAFIATLDYFDARALGVDSFGGDGNITKRRAFSYLYANDIGGSLIMHFYPSFLIPCPASKKSGTKIHQTDVGVSPPGGTRIMNIGFVGVGFMGRHMARNVLNGGHGMKVYDVNPDAADELVSLGATWAGSPREAAEGSDMIFTSLPTPQVVEEVVSGEGGVLSGARPRGSLLRSKHHRPGYHPTNRGPCRVQRGPRPGRPGVRRDSRRRGGYAVRHGGWR